MKKLFLFLVCCLGVAACTSDETDYYYQDTSSTPPIRTRRKSARYGEAVFLYTDENGDEIFNARCKKDIADCYQAAGSVCTSGFDIIDWSSYKAYGPVSVPEKRKDEDIAEKVKSGDGKFMTFGGTMLFKCKK